ncbi:MAG: hypothetical protein O7G32_12285 [SAR324 cluster bacterium]|nr:hypothetical protein [SAR324 cluster bacterium]
MRPLYYEHSGVVGFAGPLLMTAAALVTAVPGGAVFGIISQINPFIYLDGIMTVFYGFGCGWVMGLLGQMAKVRSEALTWFFGIALGLLCTFTGWVFWIYAASDFQQMWLTEPMIVWSIIAEINARGSWNLFGWEPTGYALGFFWVVEGVVITLGALGGVFTKLGQSDNIYCEACRRWTKAAFTSPPLLPVPDGDALKSALEAGDFAALQPLHPPPGGDPIDPAAPGASFTRLLVMACARCDQLHVLDVIAVSVDDDGDESENLIVDNLLIESSLTRQLQERFSGYGEPESTKG